MDLSSRACLLNEPSDGLILSSFQILDRSDTEPRGDAKQNHSLDHFLHSLSYENDNQFKEDNSQWKNNESLASSTQAKNISNTFPLDIETIKEHGRAMLRRDTSDNSNHPGPANNIDGKNGGAGGSDGGGEDDEDEDENEEGESTEMMPCHELRTDLTKDMPVQDSCNAIQLHGNTGEATNPKPMMTSHPTEYLNMQPVLPHPVYMNSATDGIWRQDPSKNEFGTALKSNESHQQECLTVTEWDGDKGVVVDKKDNLLPALENQSGDQTQTWNFLPANEHHEPHHLLPPPSHHNPHHESHWSGNISNSVMPSVDLTHSHEQHGQQEKQWIAGKNNWVHTHPGEDGDKTLILSQGQWQNHNTMAWSKDMDGTFHSESDAGRMHPMFQMTPTPSTADPSMSHSTFPEIGHTAAISYSHQQQPWSVESHYPSGSGHMYPQQGSNPSMVHCPRPSTNNYFQDPVHLPAISSPNCHFQGPSMQPITCNTSGEAKKARAVYNRRRGVTVADISTSRCKSSIDQHRPNSHPYLPKDPKMLRDGYSGCASRCNLKASHLVSWYIDYLIHENENLTQISRAFSLPVNLFHSDDFYFMDSVKKKAHFPSLKFLSWMQQKLPNININSVDFLEGRPPVVSMWNQDWFWQNKSRRDIIHDVFFYFQHRRVAYPN